MFFLGFEEKKEKKRKENNKKNKGTETFLTSPHTWWKYIKREGWFSYQALSNWSLKFLSSPIIRLRLLDLVLLRRSLLLDSWHDLGFSVFVALPRITAWGLEHKRNTGLVVVFLANQARKCIYKASVSGPIWMLEPTVEAGFKLLVIIVCFFEFCCFLCYARHQAVLVVICVAT